MGDNERRQWGFSVLNALKAPLQLQVWYLREDLPKDKFYLEYKVRTRGKDGSLRTEWRTVDFIITENKRDSSESLYSFPLMFFTGVLTMHPGELHLVTAHLVGVQVVSPRS